LGHIVILGLSGLGISLGSLVRVCRILEVAGLWWLVAYSWVLSLSQEGLRSSLGVGLLQERGPELVPLFRVHEH
jgi:hypothetical protein